jgi:glycosyltransferase involved in cell wall biosynthesis
VRVLVANKFWYRRGGLEQVMFDEVEALTGAGHEVAHFSTAHPRNEPSPFEDYFAPYLELGGETALGMSEKAVAAARLFENGEAATRFRRLIRDFRPDIVHVHGVHRQLSPSILEAAHDEGVPVVQTLHDAHKICPEDRLLRGGRYPCVPPRCHGGWYAPAIAHRCAHGSAAVSALAVCELAFQRARHVYERTITRYVSPSRFLAERMRFAGWRRTPIDVIANPVALSPERAIPGDYFLYAGRLAAGKGIETLLAAADRAKLRTIVAGEGPLMEELQGHFPNAEYVGYVQRDAVFSLLASARAAVLPSTCVENAPLAVLEPMAAAVPIVASRVGGVPELIDHGRDGILVEPGDVFSLTQALERLDADDELVAALGAAGRERVARDNSMEAHLGRLLETYAAAIGSAA